MDDTAGACAASAHLHYQRDSLEEGVFGSAVAGDLAQNVRLPAPEAVNQAVGSTCRRPNEMSSNSPVDDPRRSDNDTTKGNGLLIKGRAGMIETYEIMMARTESIIGFGLPYLNLNIIVLAILFGCKIFLDNSFFILSGRSW
jgi:hypothetical protein